MQQEPGLLAPQTATAVGEFTSPSPVLGLIGQPLRAAAPYRFAMFLGPPPAESKRGRSSTAPAWANVNNIQNQMITWHGSKKTPERRF